MKKLQPQRAEAAGVIRATEPRAGQAGRRAAREDEDGINGRRHATGANRWETVWEVSHTCCSSPCREPTLIDRRACGDPGIRLRCPARAESRSGAEGRRGGGGVNGGFSLAGFLFKEAGVRERPDRKLRV